MDTYMHKTMASVVSLEKIEIIRSEEFMPSIARLKFLKKMIILGPKTAILGPQFCRILVLGPHFWWSGGASPWIRPWLCEMKKRCLQTDHDLNISNLSTPKQWTSKYSIYSTEYGMFERIT